MQNAIKLALPVLFIVAVVIGATLMATTSKESFASVELGISELSPRGQAGGYAMPASGASVDLSFKQTGDSTWDSSASAQFADDRAVDLKWESAEGTGTWSQFCSGSACNWVSDIDDCAFISGENTPDGIPISGVSSGNSTIGTTYNRHLSLVGGSDTYTIECHDFHYETWTFCANEGSQCNFMGSRYVRFGVTSAGVDNYIVKRLSGGVSCTVEAFEADPAPGEAKACWTVPSSIGVHTLTDTAALSLAPGWDDDPECSDGVDNPDTEDSLVDADDPGCWADPDEPWTYDPDDDDESDGGWSAQCSDGVDNDGDGQTDYPDDPGCYAADDDDEDDLSPTLNLIACDSDGNCVPSGDTLLIDDSDEVSLTWTSTNTDFCDSVSTFTMPSGDPVSYTDWESGVEEPNQGDGAKAYIVACGNGGTPEVAEVVYALNLAIQLVPYPSPPIIPAEGMPVSDPATVTPEISSYDPTLCYLTGLGLDDDPTIQEMIDDGRIVGGEHEVELNAQGETTFTLTCYESVGVNPVSDETTFRILPVVQET